MSYMTRAEVELAIEAVMTLINRKTLNRSEAAEARRLLARMLSDQVLNVEGDYPAVRALLEDQNND